MKSRKEFTEAPCDDCRTSDRRGKRAILGQFCKSTQHNRTSAAMLLRGDALVRTVPCPGGAVRVRAVMVGQRRGGHPQLSGISALLSSIGC